MSDNVRDTAAITPGSRLVRRLSGESGLTLTEVLIVVAIITVLAGIVIPNLIDRMHKAEPGVLFPDASTFWGTVYPNARPGLYYYLSDNEDPNAGHGNDLDGYDEQNPGDSPREAKDIKFVLLCQHDHAYLCKYVYIEDEGPPQLATEDNDPGYDKFIKWEDGRQPTGKPGGKGGGNK